MKVRNTLALLGAFAGTAALVHGATTDITIYDGLPGVSWLPSGSDPRFSTDTQSEYGEVETHSATGAEWDLRAFGYDTSTRELTYQGGFDPVNGEGSFGFGSIFIDTARPFYSNADPDLGNDGYEFYPTGTTFGFDYAIAFDVSDGSNNGKPTIDTTLNSLAYTIYDLDSSTVLSSVFYDVQDEAGPFRYYSGGTAIATGTAQLASTPSGVAGFVDNTGANPMQDFGTSNYWLDIDLDGINVLDATKHGVLQNALDFDGATFHLTQGCGNDKLVGLTPGAIIPEPSGVFALLGLMLGGMCYRFRRPVNR